MTSLSSNSNIHQKEAAFHDNWAESIRPEDVRVEDFYNSPTALENRYILGFLGDLTGRRVLDIGCGLGESSVMFAKRGANVTATDISPEMVAFAKHLASLHGCQIETAVGAAEDLDFGEGNFDIVYTANTIHHLVEKRAFLQSAARCLKPGGTFCSWDPIKYNPIINIYRRLASQVRTEDERPLGVKDVAIVKEHFANVSVKHFWFLTLALFIKYYLVDRSNPNRERYWKKIYSETDASLRWWKPLAFLDQFLLSIPGLRWMSWNVVIIAERQK